MRRWLPEAVSALTYIMSIPGLAMTTITLAATTRPTLLRATRSQSVRLAMTGLTFSFWGRKEYRRAGCRQPILRGCQGNHRLLKRKRQANTSRHWGKETESQSAKPI